ncbi:MAG: UDP-N-acetylmuramoyl-tripeptide--D-alanyl-D-alanine ligase [Candidatus Kerfeldbacteria bacterium]|nr:UDP-N-acetylmuramoyl-tripeptide--D-alanyl-D-alanine ligase [Candidatus Kerfeldbacteria bacterium]
MKYLVRVLFQALAKLALRRYQPFVVGIAGSVGKTATKEAITAGLRAAHRTVRQTTGNFNAEVGVPVTILTGDGPRTSFIDWLGTLWRSLRIVLFGGSFPQTIVLEMGADHPGDLDRLLRIVQPQIGVLTSAAPEHLEFFGDEQAVIEEETLIVRRLAPGGTAIVNRDDERIATLLESMTGRIVTYGWHAAADVRAESYSITRNTNGLPVGMIVKISIAGSSIPVALPGVLGRHQVYPLLAAVAVGQVVGDETMAVIQRLQAYQPPPGRMRLLAGLEGSMILDDSYNASPEAVQAALETLRDTEIPGRRIAILGQMSELGSATTTWHERIGQAAAGMSLAKLVTVGPLAQRIGQAAAAAGMPAELIQNVATAQAAATAVMADLGPGDMVLCKGSRYASRLERTVRMLLVDPDRDSQQLVHSDE